MSTRPACLFVQFHIMVKSLFQSITLEKGDSVGLWSVKWLLHGAVSMLSPG